MKWRLAYVILCDKNVLPKSEGEFYVLSDGQINYAI